jgi:hypothetical protein
MKEHVWGVGESFVVQLVGLFFSETRTRAIKKVKAR